MAKDGTNMGGRQVRAGGKPEPLADKLINKRPAKVLDIVELKPESHLNPNKLNDVSELQGEDMANPSNYLKSKQRDGKPFHADKLFAETWEWLKKRGCEKFVNPKLIEAYAQAFTRYIQCEEDISRYGLLGKHPTTGAAISSPFVQMSQSFQKQSNLIWYEIFDIVKQNCTTSFVGNPQEDIMEKLLSGRKN